MPRRSQLQAIIGVVVMLWAALLFASGVTLNPSYLKPLSLAISITYFVLLAFERFLWRIPIVARLLQRPVLRGTWRGTLESDWIDPVTGEAAGVVEVFLAVRQTYSTIAMRLMSRESSSRSLAAALDTPRDDVATASSTYQNVPRLLIQGRSRIHHGALMLEVHGSPPTQLVGSYWTDRDTKGEVHFTARLRKVFTSFDEAAGAAWPTFSDPPDRAAAP